jgi:phosphoribosylformylglycinamidine synthase
VALAESCILGGLGFQGERWEVQGRLDATLFGERQSRIIVSLSPDRVSQLEELAASYGVPLKRLGVVGGKRFFLPGIIDLPLEQIEQQWRRSLEKLLEQPVSAT